MKTLNNPKPIEEIVKDLPTMKEKIEESTKEMKNYLEYLNDEKFNEQQNETEEDAIKRAESIYDRLDEMVQRRKLVMKNGKETIELIDIVKLKIKNVVESCENDEIHLEKANDELIDKIIDLEDRKRIRDITPLQQQIDEINNKFNIKKIEWESNLTKRKKDDDLRKQQEEKLNTVIDINEMKQLEEWTGMKIGNIIFDSNVDNWNVNTSVFDQKVINKSNLIFLIEDDDGNKFGSYINATIEKCNSFINDPKSFVFSLKSNGRLNGMSKFDISYPQNAFVVDAQTNNYCLFMLGYENGKYDIMIHRENNKTQSFCNQTSSFKYKGIQNALCGKRYFTPKRITVIHLI